MDALLYYYRHLNYMRQSYHRRRAKRRDARLCLRCGKRPPAKGRRNCQTCIDYMRRQWIEYKKRRAR